MKTFKIGTLHLFVPCLIPLLIHGHYDSWNPYETACKSGTCTKGSKTCECIFIIEHRLTMMAEKNKTIAGFPVKPSRGKLYRMGNQEVNQTKYNILTADGEGVRLVIAVNGKFPGPAITTYEGQTVIIEVRNKMHTDSTSIHWHGIHQKGTPWVDGVAFISQCPILPGDSYTYRFNATPHGTSFYHAHIGDQRTMGLYGALIIIPPDNVLVSQPQEYNSHSVLLQDWNHDDNAETIYLKMINGDFDFASQTEIETTHSIDGANFSRYHMHSGLINGKGRFITYNNQFGYKHNGAPLEVFRVQSVSTYRFRVVSASTLYPFRVYVQDHRRLALVASDGYEMKPIFVESFIIHPGERYDFLLDTKAAPESTYILIAESLEVNIGKKLHIAEAIIWYDEFPFNYPGLSLRNPCSKKFQCVTFNCPYLYYPPNDYRECLTYNIVKTRDPTSNINDVIGQVKELFFNFAFPGKKGDTPGSINGRQFIPPTVPALTQSEQITTKCQNECSLDKVCRCTHSVTIEQNQIYQFVLTNLGIGRGWSHPVHLHGHSFYVMYMGFGQYDPISGLFINPTKDICCNDTQNYCNSAKWDNPAWADGHVPHARFDNPAQKDTIIVPSGGYVVIRFKADNPGVWYFHCHIDLHNTNGMGMIVYEGDFKNLNNPNVDTCGVIKSTEYIGGEKTLEITGGVLGVLFFVSLIFNGAFIYYIFKRRNNQNYNHIGD